MENTVEMTEQEMFNTITKRAKELLAIPQIAKEYQSKENEAAAKDWIFNQALVTLLYSHEERMELVKRKQVAL